MQINSIIYFLWAFENVIATVIASGSCTEDENGRLHSD
jgi:hypothetical protein